jgi:lysophospholipase L1-like esterase
VVLAGGDRQGISGVEGGSWMLWWVASDGVVEQVRSTSAHLPAVPVSADTANLLSPDRECSLVLSGRSAQAPVVVIGDSVFARIQHQLATTGLPDAAFARSWLITAESGFGWGASAPSWPLSTIRGSWAIGVARGLLSGHPSSLVVELGDNDSLRATFADALHKPRLASQIRGAVVANISQLLAQSAQLVPCTVLVTVPVSATTLFGGGALYQREGRLVDSVIRSAAAGARNERVALADWATLSAQHHLAQGSPANWFTPDGLHPNQAGEEALLGLVRQAAASCRDTPATTLLPAAIG